MENNAKMIGFTEKVLSQLSTKSLKAALPYVGENSRIIIERLLRERTLKRK